MAKKTEHTKTPFALWPTHWAGGWGEHSTLPNRIRITANDRDIVAYIEHHGNGDKQNKYPTNEDYANAEFIIRACNNFDDLLALCQRAKPFLASLPGKEGVNARDLLECMKAAIIKATT